MNLFTKFMKTYTNNDKIIYNNNKITIKSRIFKIIRNQRIVMNEFKLTI